MIKYLFIFCLLGAAWQFLNSRAAKRKAETAAAAIAAAAAAAKPASPRENTAVPAGFVYLPAPNNAPLDKVLVVAPPDSPPDVARRAEALLAELRTAGIPCLLAGQVAFTVATHAEASNVNAFMTGPLPMVFIRDKACANPPLADIISEYRRTTPK